MDDQERLLIEALRAEAIALFEVNQAGRSAAERSVALLLSIAAITVAAGIDAGNDAVALVLPPFLLLIFSYMCQQYAELTVVGAARARIEEEIYKRLGARRALIYEYAVAPIRKESPLVESVRVLQTLVLLLIVTAIIVGFVIAFEGQRWYVSVAYVTFTLAAGLSAAISYVAMLRSWRVASERLVDVFRETDARTDPPA